MNTQAKVALDKQKFPERYCKEPRCLWKVVHLVTVLVPMHQGGNSFMTTEERGYEPNPNCPGGRCPRHQRKSQ